MKNTQSNLGPIKIGKQLGTTCCFGCKDYTKHFRPEKVKKIFKTKNELKINFIIIR